MAELSLSLPVKGEEAPGADAKVNAAFSEIQTQFNGKVAAVNLEAKAVGDAAIAANRALVTTNNVYVHKNFTKAEGEAEQEFSATRMVFLVIKATEEGMTLKIGGVAVAAPTNGKTVSYLIPPALKVFASTTMETFFLTL